MEICIAFVGLLKVLFLFKEAKLNKISPSSLWFPVLKFSALSAKGFYILPFSYMRNVLAHLKIIALTHKTVVFVSQFQKCFTWNHCTQTEKSQAFISCHFNDYDLLLKPKIQCLRKSCQTIIELKTLNHNNNHNNHKRV